MAMLVTNGYPYSVTLTNSERKALSWIGHRYFHGHELIALLGDADGNWSYSFAGGDYLPEQSDVDWDSPMPIKFDFAEHVAWEIKDGIESEDSQLACLAPELKEKLLTLCDSVV